VREEEKPAAASSALPPRVGSDASLHPFPRARQRDAALIAGMQSPGRPSAIARRSGAAQCVGSSNQSLQAAASSLLDVLDPRWVEGVLDDGRPFWYQADDPQNPSLKKPLLPPLEAARLMYSTRAKGASK
jgi:hypothetical protein